MMQMGWREAIKCLQGSEFIIRTHIEEGTVYTGSTLCGFQHPLSTQGFLAVSLQLTQWQLDGLWVPCPALSQLVHPRRPQVHSPRPAQLSQISLPQEELFFKNLKIRCLRVEVGRGWYRNGGWGAHRKVVVSSGLTQGSYVLLTTDPPLQTLRGILKDTLGKATDAGSGMKGRGPEEEGRKFFCY